MFWLHSFVPEYTPSLEQNPYTAGGSRRVGLESGLCPYTARSAEELMSATESSLGCNLSPKILISMRSSLCSPSFLNTAKYHRPHSRLTELEQLSSAGDAPFPTIYPCKWQCWGRQWPWRVQAEQLTHSDWQAAKVTTSRSGCRSSHTQRCGYRTMPIS